MDKFVIFALVLAIFGFMWLLDRSLERTQKERVERQIAFLQTLSDRQREFISLTEVVLREATEHPIAIAKPSASLPVAPPTWTRKKSVENFIGKDK